ncbi:MAG: flagellin [Desulfobacteraceae bacterium]|nr:MAG: flagellin [Desulfobacteraceae bacterium]
MALRIQTNIPALNTQRQLSMSSANMNKSLERLSSGYRINRAADDAAGLAIAGKLRTNIRSFVKAAENTAQATSMLQVAEGAMDQVENIVNRLKELATQAASTNTDTNGRSRLNDEFTALVAEIDRIAESTKYGSTNLINGNYGAEVTTGNLGALMSDGAGIASASSVDVSGHIGASGAAYTITDGADSGITLSNGLVSQTVTIATGAQTINFDSLGVKITVDNSYNDHDVLTGGVFTVTNATEKVQVGTTSNSNDMITLSMGNLSTDQTWDCANALTNWGVDTVAKAQSALNSIDTAITYVTEKRGDLGAMQNRLGYAAANLATTIENVSAAESTIRDVDMAQEMSSFTKNQILMQAGTAMLSQANMAPQQVLSLFG